MSRPGYKEAKAYVTKALSDVDSLLSGLVKVESMNVSDALKAIHRNDLQKGLDKAQAELAQAQSEFALFDRKIASVPRRYFDVQRSALLSFTHDMNAAILQRLEKDGIGFPELIRRAL